MPPNAEEETADGWRGESRRALAEEEHQQETDVAEFELKSCRVEEKHAELPLAEVFQLKATKIAGLLGSCLASIFMRSNYDSSCNILIDAMSRTEAILHSPENIFSS